VDSVVSAQLVAGAVVSRPWGSGTVARVLTVVDYSLIPLALANEAGGQMKVIRPEMERRARQATACAVQLLQKSGIERAPME